jgi:hypothetical protein
MDCFYEDGLHFTCKPGCRYCCGVEPGFVFISDADLDRLSSFLHLSPREFIHRYCRKVPMGSISYISLLERENHDCVFLEKYGCSVYKARPVQCATYPFWNTIVADRQSWEREADWCPGIGHGELHGREEIDHLLRLRQGVEPAIWESY